MKFSIIHYVLVILLIAPLELLEMFLEPAGIAILFLPLEILISAIIILWFWIAGAEYKTFAVGTGLELIPGVGWLPIRIATVLRSMYKTNHPGSESGGGIISRFTGWFRSGSNRPVEAVT